MNLTITVDPEVLKQARIRALEENTSVNSVLNEFLVAYASSKERCRLAVTDLLRLSRESTSGSDGERRWTREELHER